MTATRIPAPRMTAPRMPASRIPARSALAACVVACLALALPACSKPGAPGPEAKKEGGGKPAMRFPVDVAPVEAKAVDYLVKTIGSVEAFEEVEVTARVAGAALRVRFQEGDAVKQGAVLVEIEPERYQIAVQAARATRDRADAARKDAELTLTRREALSQQGLASTEDLDSARTKVALASAELAQARASLSLAELNLREAIVRAPEAGVMQTRTVRTGQYVQAGAVLASLVRRDPLKLRFEVPEHEVRGIVPGTSVRFTVRGIEGQQEATITHVAESASETTRMVPLVARIDHPADALRPGTFAEVSIAVGSKGEAPLVPQSAARPSARGFIAFVVEDGVAKERVLELGMRTADGLVEVRSGLRAGESLILRGGEALRDGASVRVDPGASGSGAPLAASAPPGEAKPAPPAAASGKGAGN